MTETVMSTSRVALSKSIHISTANSVKYSRGAYFSYEQFYCDLEIPLSFYVAFKLHIATKLLLDSMLLDSAHLVVTMTAH